EVRLPARRHPPALLLGQRRGRAHHDDRPARVAVHARAPRPPPLGPRGSPDRPGRGAQRGPGRPVPRMTSATGTLVLAVESSCDETGIALVEGGSRIHSNVVASQVALHAPTGGIVPEVAARAHLRWILPVLDEAWSGSGVGWQDVDAVAVTHGPGLAGSLL